MLIDLDPQDCPYDMIVEAALLVRDKLDAIGLQGYPKTTGGDGMHIYIPLEPIYSYDESRTFAEILAHLVQRDRPELFTTPRAVSKRQKGRVYFDWMQNGKSKTIAAPYVLRAYPGAPVATPLDWSEVQARPDADAVQYLQCAGALRQSGRPVPRRPEGSAEPGNISGETGKAIPRRVRAEEPSR